MEGADDAQTGFGPGGVVEVHGPAAGDHEGVAHAVADEGVHQPVSEPHAHHPCSFF